MAKEVKAPGGPEMFGKIGTLIRDWNGRDASESSAVTIPPLVEDICAVAAACMGHEHGNGDDEAQEVTLSDANVVTAA